MTNDEYLKDITALFADYRRKAEQALAQVLDQAFFAQLDPGTNSPAMLVKHLGGNLRSRWRDVLTTDGEKPDRHRDTEFEITPEDTRTALMAHWASGWSELEKSLHALTAEDISRTILIRAEPLPLFHALHRALTHAAEHVGQIVLLAKYLAGPDWQTLSIARGKSEDFNRTMRESKK
jgi:hypothetical protein